MNDTRIWKDIDNGQDRMHSGNSKTYSLAPISNNTDGVEATVNVVLIDTSNSTEEATSRQDKTSKLIREKEVATMFTSKLPASTYFSLISFADPARLEVPLRPLSEKLAVIQAVQKLDYSGGTGMRKALTLALKELEKAPVNYFKRVYCITDGMGTDGNCSKIANSLKATGAQLHFIGFGKDNEIDEVTMRQLASLSESGAPLYMHFTEFKQLSDYMKTETQRITY